MTNQEIAAKVQNYILDKFEYQRKIEQGIEPGGQLRCSSGDIVENVIQIIWEELSKNYPKSNATVCTGSTTPFQIIDNAGNHIEESVDKHCYINNKLVLCVECKTYLDKCYMQRADSDFNLMKTYDKTFKSIIVAHQDGIAKQTFDFFMNRHNIDKVFYFANTKRNSSKARRIYNNPDEIQYDLILKLVEYMEGFFINGNR